MSTETTTHAGCRVCSRTDVRLKVDQTLRMHVRADLKGGNSFLLPGGNRCSGASHPPKGVLGAYTKAVLDVLAPHFPDLTTPITAEVIGEAIQQHRTTPYDTFEALLTSTGTWRLRPHQDIPGRVRLACWKEPDRETDQDRDREQAINAQLDAVNGLR
ncbi:hypothetical protein ACFYY8_31465 [Streptosporangium sp. NPDC001559]|uniref:hypothetical protein n=1 Tax=Streptosporangium sp. NPDC001559 TaxID=3366187 RepID=UPI0036E781F6